MAVTARPRGLTDRAPAPLLFVVGAVSQYAGAAVAVLLFTSVPAAGVAWLRVVAAAAVLAVWRRPWAVLLGWRGSGRSVSSPWLVVAFGVALACMNLAFYLAIDRLPLGTAVAIEFLGPIAVAAAGTRTLRDGGAFLLAVSGVALIADVQWQVSPVGVLYALTAAGLWAVYIVLGSRVARTGTGIDGLAAGMVAGALILAPFTAGPAWPALTRPALLAACLGVGVLSSVVPYVLDQLVLTRTGPGRFALLLCLLPATAAVVGAVVLGQVPAVAEAAGIGLVVAAVAARSPSG